MSNSSDTNLDLDKPPIFEVVCGVHFTQLTELDPLVQGLFWSEIQDEYPAKNIRPPLNLEEPVSDPSSFRIRSWFRGADENYLLQLQDDRLLLNWRRSNGTYPRFQGTEDEDGIASKALREYERFQDFCSRALRGVPDSRAIELAKINLVQEDEHWNSRDELVSILPVLDGTAQLLGESELAAAFKFNMPVGEGVRIEIDTVTIVQDDGSSEKQAIRVELRTGVTLTAPEPEENLDDALHEANERINRSFLEIFPDAESVFAEER